MAKAKNAFRAMMTEAEDKRYDKKMGIKDDSKRDKEQDKKMRVKQK